MQKQNVLLITIPVYDKRDTTVLDSVRGAIKAGHPDFISLSYYTNGKPHCLVLVLRYRKDDDSAAVLGAHVEQWKKWRKASPEVRRYWRKIAPKVVDVYEVDSSFEMEVAHRIEGIEDFIPAILWDMTREG
ncbi:MAG: hypothetical protein NT170_04455 [Candidatus Moranbacteria bacterium]|nr:hypothetical protein [Candidatus Moranbacteria bacterium]